AYFEDFLDSVPGTCLARRATLGEMHVRRGRYIGVAPVPGALTNVCVVKPSGPADPALADPSALLRREPAPGPPWCARPGGGRHESYLRPSCSGRSQWTWSRPRSTDSSSPATRPASSTR